MTGKGVSNEWGKPVLLEIMKSNTIFQKVHGFNIGNVAGIAKLTFNRIKESAVRILYCRGFVQTRIWEMGAKEDNKAWIRWHTPEGGMVMVDTNQNDSVKEEKDIVTTVLERLSDKSDAEFTEEEASAACLSLMAELDCEDKVVSEAAHTLIKHFLPKIDKATKDQVLHQVVLYEL